MITNPIAYREASAALVAQYENDPAKASTYWSDDAATPIRKEIKAHYIIEQKHLCCYCGLPDPSNHGLDWDVEHVVPQKLHPHFLFTPVNLSVACRECNSSKGAKETLVDSSATAYPSTSDAYLIVHPHFDDWTDHILRDHLTYAAITPKGNWTITECRLNRFDERLVGLRYPISDNRYEEPVRRFLVDGVSLQQVVDQIKLRLRHRNEGSTS